LPALTAALQVDGVFYGFSGCHRYAAHLLLGLPTILCFVRPATRQTLKMHMM
jgi:sulfiredoxin